MKTDAFGPAFGDLPAHMQDGARAYIQHGLMPGGFLFSVLCNDLHQSFCKADWSNERNMKQWAAWLESIPRGAWGSKESVNNWIEVGGLDGLAQEKEAARDGQ